MSLRIKTEHINEVLLADGWHNVIEGSFILDSYEFMDRGDLVHGGGEAGICATGFWFTEPNGLTTEGPLTSVIAVRRSS